MEEKNKSVKIKDLNLLPKNHLVGVNIEEIFDIVSWDDLVLEKIDGEKLFLRVKEGIRGAGQTSEDSFKKNIYNQLTNEEKERINKIFTENIGETIGSILELCFLT